MTLVGVVIRLIIGSVLAWAVDRLMGAFGIQDPARTSILVAFVLLILFAFVHSLFPLP